MHIRTFLTRDTRQYNNFTNAKLFKFAKINDVLLLIALKQK